jgi:hypothetical protein
MQMHDVIFNGFVYFFNVAKKTQQYSVVRSLEKLFGSNLVKIEKNIILF